MSLRLLYVCTGNVCRSPMAEHLFRGWAGPGGDVEVSSAGTQALVGHGIDFSSASALGQLGIDSSAHRARQFEPWMAAEADVILTAERAHRDQVLTDVPNALRRTFTMKEFARVSRLLGPVDPGAVVAEVALARGRFGEVPADDDDMPDPYRGAISRARTIAEQITDTVQATIAALGLGPGVAVDAVTQPAARPSPRRRRPLPS